MKTTIKPYVGGYFSPYKDGNFRILQLVKEDDLFYYFEDLTKYSKELPWWWFEREKPAETIESDQPFVFPYESYSLWSRQLAESYSLKELEKELAKCENLTGKYAVAHLNSIKRTTSMQSNSQARAHAGNNVTSNYERKQAYKNAIEIHKNFPELSYKS